MRRGKRLLIMLLALALVALAAAGAVYLLPDEDLEEYEEITLLSFEQEDAQALSYTYEDETVELVNDDGTWEYALDADFPLDSSYVDSMLASLSSLAATQEITAPEDTAQYGLDEPVLTAASAMSPPATATSTWWTAPSLRRSATDCTTS